MIKYIMGKACLLLFGRRNYYRLARHLWLDARRDGANRMGSNGEFALQQKLVKRAAALSAPVIFDIGANVGNYSEELLRQATAVGIGDRLQLYAFEPNPTCAVEADKRLKAFEGKARYSLEPTVITDSNGKTSFFITGDTAGSSSISIDEKWQQGREIEAACRTLDQFCADRGIDAIFFAKVDTEGNDMRVLKGAQKLLEAGKITYLQFEYNHRWILFRNYLKDVFDLVEPFGYLVAKVTPEGLELYPRWHFELEVFWEGNYLIGKDFEALGLPLLKSVIVR